MNANWESMIGETALAEILPQAYARYRKPVQGALGLFLDLLPSDRQAEILRMQSTLPPSASAAQRLALLARGCPVLHKLGQSLARDRRLPDDLRGHLQELESLPPSIDPESIRVRLIEELGPLERLGVTLLPPALAEASVAVVIPFRWDKAGQGRRHGVFKLLKPGIAQRLDTELSILEEVGVYLDRTCEAFDLPPLDYRETFEQVRDKLRHEVRLDREQRHLTMAADFYRHQPGIRIPGLYPFGTPRVTAMEYIPGGKVTAHGLGSSDGRKLAEQVIRGLIVHPILSPRPQALFHADPHAGNLLLAEDGRLTLLDWSLTGALGERERTAMVQILLSALSLDGNRIAGVLRGLDTSGRARAPELKAVAHAWLQRIRRGGLPGFTWLTGLLDEAVQRAGLRPGVDLLMFRRTLHTLEGVVVDIGARKTMVDEVLMREFMAQLAVEWPRRWLQPAGSRAFATRLSNADLMGLALGFPGVYRRYWFG